MKINKKLSAAIVLSLMMGVYGNASAEDIYLYGASSGNGEVISGVSPDKAATIYESNATNTGANYTVGSGNWYIVYGGYGDMGNVENNHVKVTDGEIQLWVMGGFSMGSASESISVLSNIVEISGTTVVRNDVSGGTIQHGNAINNEAIVTGGTIYVDVLGGEVANRGDAIGNTVSINGASATEKVQITGNVYGGQSANGEANNNKVGVVDSTGDLVGAATNFTANRVYGGKGTTGADGNKVWLGEGANVNEVYGGDGTNGATSNEVWLGAGARAVNVLGGNSGGDSVNNKVTIETGADVYMLLGGQSLSGDAIENKVTVKGTVATDVSGGSAGKGNATGNEVTITDGTIGTAGYGNTGFVYGGWTKNGTVSSNQVNISGAAKVVGNVYGGYVKTNGTAESNEVTISDGTFGTIGVSDTGFVYGGYANNGNAGGYDEENKKSLGNKVTIAGGTFGTSATTSEVIGGQGTTGASYNEVTLNGANAKVYGKVIGGKADGAVEQNTVTLTEGAILGDGYAIGGMSSNNNATKNQVTVGSANVQFVYGGKADNGTASENIVTINAGKLGGSSGQVYGGDGNIASKNKVYVNGGNFNTSVYGGWGDSKASENYVKVAAGVNSQNLIVYGGYSVNGEVSKNVVDVYGKPNSVRGGYSTGSGAVSENVVNLYDGCEVNNVYGGDSDKGNVSENIINVNGNVTVIFDMVAGKSPNSEANKNIINIDTAGIVTVNGNLIGGEGSKTSGNTLNVYSSGNEAGGLKGFQEMNFFIPAAAKANDVMVNVNDTATIEGAVNITGFDQNKLSKDETLYMVKASKIEGTANHTVNGTSVQDGDNLRYASTNTNGVNVDQVLFTANAKEISLTKKDSFLTGKFVGKVGSPVENALKLDSGANGYENIYGTYSEDGKAYTAIVDIKDAVDLSNSTIYGNNVSAAGNTLNVSAVDVQVKGIEKFDTMNFALNSDVKAGTKVLAVTGDVKDVKEINISGVANTGLNSGETANVLSAGNINAGVAYNLDGQAVENGDTKNYASTNTNGVNVDQVLFTANAKEISLTKKDAFLTGKFVGKVGTPVEKALVLDSAANGYENIYGAYDETGAEQTATVTFGDGLTLTNSTIYGNNATGKGAVLEVKGSNVKVKGIENFDTMNFYIPKDADTSTVLVTSTNDVKLNGVTVAAGFHNDTALTYGDKVTLISAPKVEGMDSPSELKVADTDFTDYDVLVYQANSAKEEVTTGNATTLVAELVNMEINENSKILLETTMAGATIINDGSDMLAGAGFDSAVSAIAGDLETGAPSGSMSLFGAVSGNKSKIKTGSHVDVKGWNMNLGLAKELKNKDGKMIIGPVVEYGRGDYDSYLDNGYHGEGNSHYVGGGVMAKQINNNGNYFEGSLRAGKLTKEFKSTGGSYDSDAKYMAGHIGVGHIQKMDAKNSMDYYAKFFHTHVSDDDVIVNAKGKKLALDLDSMNSSRLRIGGRLNHAMGKNNAYYFGLAYQREFNGSATGALEGKDIVAPSTKGDTGFMELGVKLFDASKYDLDFGGFGSIGKKKGAGINLNFNWKF